MLWITSPPAGKEVFDSIHGLSFEARPLDLSHLLSLPFLFVPGRNWNWQLAELAGTYALNARPSETQEAATVDLWHQNFLIVDLTCKIDPSKQLAAPARVYIQISKLQWSNYILKHIKYIYLYESKSTKESHLRWLFDSLRTSRKLGSLHIIGRRLEISLLSKLRSSDSDISLTHNHNHIFCYERHKNPRLPNPSTPSNSSFQSSREFFFFKNSFLKNV